LRHLSKTFLYFCKMNKIILELIALSATKTENDAFALILGERNSKKRLPIIIGIAEAQSIAVAIEGLNGRRPLTHDLFKSLAMNYGINLKEVMIDYFKDGIFYAKLICERDGKLSVIDSRASDAVALALRFRCPIYTNSMVMDEAGIIINDDELVENDKRETTLNETNLTKMDVNSLKIMLQEAIDNEDYELASRLRDEINRRK